MLYVALYVYVAWCRCCTWLCVCVVCGLVCVCCRWFGVGVVCGSVCVVAGGLVWVLYVAWCVCVAGGLV